MSDEADRVATYRAAVAAVLGPVMPDLGRITIADTLPAFPGDAVADIDAQHPQVLDPRALGAWASAQSVTLVAAAPWALALGPPDTNLLVTRTHARESEMANVRSYTGDVAPIADARRVVEGAIAPWLPLGAARRALVHLRAGLDPATTAAAVAALEARETAFAPGPIAHETLANAIPRARELAVTLAAAARDFRAEAYLTKLLHAAIEHRRVPELAPLMPDTTSAAIAGNAVDKLELDRALFAFAYHWADDPALEPYVTYRGVRLDDLASRLLLRRFGIPHTRTNSVREVIDAVNILAAMDRRRAHLATGAPVQEPQAPLEAIRELTAAETDVLDAAAAPGTAEAVRAHVPGAIVDRDETREHDAAIVGTALARTAATGGVLERIWAALKPGGRALILVPNRRSLFLVAGLAKNRPWTLAGAWPETGPGAVTLAETNALLAFAGFTDIAVCARIGETVPADVVFPAQIAYDGVALRVHTADDLRDFLTIAYVVAGRRPISG